MATYPLVGVVNVNRGLEYWKLSIESLKRQIDEPIAVTGVLVPSDLGSGIYGNDFTVNVSSGTGTAAVTSTASGTLVCFLPDKREFVVSGTMYLFLSLELVLGTVDATVSGSVSLSDIKVTVENYDYSASTGDVIGSVSHSVGEIVSGTAASSKSWNELIAVDIPRTVIGNGKYLKLSIELDVSAVSGAGAATGTSGSVTVGLLGKSYVYIPVV